MNGKKRSYFDTFLLTGFEKSPEEAERDAWIGLVVLIVIVVVLFHT